MSRILLSFTLCLPAATPIVGEELIRDKAWTILTAAIDNGGPNAQLALQLLGGVEDDRGRALVRSILSGTSGPAINAVAKGLAASQCGQYLQELRRAALDPSVEPKMEIVATLGRAGNPEAARALVEIADQRADPLAGIAFGSVELMGSLAKPVLIQELTTGRSAKGRETAAHILRRLGATEAVAAYRSALSDSDSNVRLAAALGLAQLGLADSTAQLELAAKGGDVDHRIEAVTALAILGRLGAIDALKTIVTSSEEALRGEAVWAIARSGNARLKSLAYELKLHENVHFRSMLVEKLLDPSEPQDLAVLRATLGDKNEMSALIAARRLLGTPSESLARPTITRCLQSRDQHVQLYALKVASESTVMADELASSINEPDPAVKAAAISASADARQKGRFNEVQQYLTSDSPAVSLSAAKALLSLDSNRARGIFESHLDSDIDHVRIHSAAMLLARADGSSTPR